MSLSIRQALALSQTLSSATARLDTEVLLCHCLAKPRSYLRAWPERLLSEAELAAFNGLLSRRQTGEPIAYITGEREFWSLPLKASPATLIPRPETELLVETALGLNLPEDCQALDLGTGTGAIALALAKERPAWIITATDYSAEAVALARLNSQALSLPIELLQSHWFSALSGRYHLILSNPPYIDEADPHLLEGDVRFEPASALVAGAKGLQDLFTIIEQAPGFLTPGGWLLLEHGWQQATAVVAALTKRGFIQVRWQPDLAGQPRMSLGQWPESMHD